MKRFDKNAKQKISVSCPNIVKVYNKVMGGVDLADMLLSLNRINYRSKKWYNRVFAHLLDIATNNAWVLYKRDYNSMKKDKKFMPLKKFRFYLANALCVVAGSDNVALHRTLTSLNTVPHDEIRFDHVGTHFPSKDENKKRLRCKQCSKKSSFKCEKCNIHLCVNIERDCFKKFHSRKLE